MTTADTSAGGFGNNNMDNVETPGRPKPGPSLRRIVIGSDFFRVYRPHLLAGRLFDDAHRMDDPSGFQHAVARAWRRVAPQVPYEAELASNRMRRLYSSDERAGVLFEVATCLALAIGGIGLLALAAFDTTARAREIAIRKVLGASRKDVVMLLIIDILKPVLAATVIAWPIGFFAARRWLTGFDDHIALLSSYFVVSTFVVAALAAAAVTGQAISASRTPPGLALQGA